MCLSGCDHIEVYAIQYMLYDLLSATDAFKWCSVEGAKSGLWRRPNCIANTVLILLCDPSLRSSKCAIWLCQDCLFISISCFADTQHAAGVAAESFTSEVSLVLLCTLEYHCNLKSSAAVANFPTLPFSGSTPWFCEFQAPEFLWTYPKSLSFCHINSRHKLNLQNFSKNLMFNKQV